MGKALVLDKVSKSYGELKALDAVSLQVDAGEFVALLGPNGAGKSTLFQLLSGLFVADSGSIKIQGADLAHNMVSVLASLGIVFQQSVLDLDTSVMANLRYHCRLHGLGSKKSHRRIAEELGKLDMLDSLNVMARSLSGGNRRKVELARALLHDPAILLMDEATVGLDPESRRTLINNVHELKEVRGMGVLWATHLVDEALSADQVVILNKGKILAHDTPRSIIENSGQTSLEEAFLTMIKTDDENGR